MTLKLLQIIFLMSLSLTVLQWVYLSLHNWLDLRVRVHRGPLWCACPGCTSMWLLILPNKLMFYYTARNCWDCHLHWDYYYTRNSTGGFFLAPAEGCSLQLQQKGLLGPKVILPDGRTDGRTTDLRELDCTVENLLILK